MADALRLPRTNRPPRADLEPGPGTGRGVRAPRRRRSRGAGQAVQTDFYFPKEIDNSRLVKVADPRERGAQVRLLVFTLVVGALFLVAAYQRFATIRAGYRIEELKSQREHLIEANRQLRLEEASLRDPRRIDSIARNQLGLVAPAPGQVVHLENPVAEPGGAVVARVQVPPVDGALKGAPPSAAP